VMMDGSLQEDGKTPRTLQENLDVTRKAVEAAHALGVSTEGEIGRLGQVSDEQSEDILTDPDEAAQFVEATGVDMLAVAIGTTHGLYKGTPKIYTDRVAEIRERTNMPLVMHGGTGVPDEPVVAGVKNGIRKINIDTQMRVACHEALWKVMNEVEEEYKQADAEGNPRKYDIRRLLAPARDAIRIIAHSVLAGTMGDISRRRVTMPGSVRMTVSISSAVLSLPSVSRSEPWATSCGSPIASST